eukprot:7430037-Pyramimonas_sp.AAC.1
MAAWSASCSCRTAACNLQSTRDGRERVGLAILAGENHRADTKKTPDATPPQEAFPGYQQQDV